MCREHTHAGAPIDGLKGRGGEGRWEGGRGGQESAVRRRVPAAGPAAAELSASESRIRVAMPGPRRALLRCRLDAGPKRLS